MRFSLLFFIYCRLLSLLSKLIALFCALRLPVLVIAARVSGLCVPAEKQTCKHSLFLLLHHAHFFVETVYDAAIVCGAACLRELGGWNILWHQW